MATYSVKVPNKVRNRVKVIRQDEMIRTELEYRKRRLADYFHTDDYEEDEEEIIEDKLQEIKSDIIEEEIKEKEIITYWEQFRISNFGVPMQVSMDKISEPTLPISIVKEEIQNSYDKGVSDGQLQAKATFMTEVEKYHNWIRRIDQVAEELVKQNRDSIKIIEKSLVDLALLVAKHILQREALEDRNVVVEQALKAISTLDDATVFKINVNPLTYQVIEEAKSSLLPDKTISQKIIIAPDDSVDVGGCVLETSAGTIDAKMGTQIGMLKNALEDTLLKYYSERSQEIDQQAKKIRDNILTDEMRREVYDIDENQSFEISDEEEQKLSKNLSQDDIEKAMREEWGDEFFDEEFTEPID